MLSYLCGSPRRFALPASHGASEGGRANRLGEPRIRVVRVIQCKKVTPSFIPAPQVKTISAEGIEITIQFLDSHHA